jgi:L-amino acid N-acyltransferase YncA
MKIRKAEQKDLKEVSQLYEKEMSKQFKLIGEKPLKANEFEKRLKNNFKKSNMYILDIEGIKGFIWYFEESNEFNLEEIFVVMKEKGHGKLLINFLLQKAKKKKIKRINLDVHFKNKSAQEFFRKFKFSERTIEMSRDLK